MSLGRQKRLGRIIDFLQQKQGTLGCSVNEVARYLFPEGDLLAAKDLRNTRRDLRFLEKEKHLSTSHDESGVIRWKLRQSTPLWPEVGKPVAREVALIMKMAKEAIANALPKSSLKLLESEEGRLTMALSRGLTSADPGWAGRVKVVADGYRLSPARLDDDVVRQVYEAVEKNVRITLTVSERPRDRTFEATIWGMVVHGPRITLVVCEKAGALPFSVPLSSITLARCLGERGSAPFEFKLDDWLRCGGLDEQSPRPAAGGQNQMLRIKLRCTHRLAALWQAHAIGEEQRLGFDSPDFVTVEATVEDSFALRSYLLSLGARVAVDEPDELRGWLRDQGSKVSDGTVAEP